MNQSIANEAACALSIVAGQWNGILDELAELSATRELAGPLERPALGVWFLGHPWFWADAEQVIHPVRADLLGLFAMRNIVRGGLIGLEYLSAGDLLMETRHRAPAVACYYTSAYHLMDAFLATHGRVMSGSWSCPRSFGLSETARSRGWSDVVNRPDELVAVLSRRKAWSVEGLKRAHVSRWTQLKRVLQPRGFQVPDYLLAFLRYVVSHGPSGLEPEDDDFVDQALTRLAQGRHAALYQGYGSDDFAADALTNREPVDPAAMNRRPLEYRKLATGLLGHAADAVTSVMGAHSEKEQAAFAPILSFAVHTRPFEFPMTRCREPAGKVMQAIGLWLLTAGKNQSSWSEVREKVLADSDNVGEEAEGD